MQIRNIKKAFGLLVADLVIIIGIFVLQFRTDSSIIEKIRNLHITLEKSDSEDTISQLNNKLLASYKGLIIYCDDLNPVEIKYKDDTKKQIQLQSYTKSANSFELNFSDNVKLIIGLFSEEENSALFASSNLPSNVASLSVPYKFASNMKIEKTEGSKTIVTEKKLLWELSAPLYDDDYITFSSGSNLSYNIHDETKKFSFDSIVEIADADVSVFQKNVDSIKTNLINSFVANTTEANITEQIAVSYVAAKASDGLYTKAIEEIPVNIKKSKTRTYLSAPYFNTLSEMNLILETYLQSTELQISKAVTSGSLDIFTIRNIADFLCISANQEAVIQLLNNAANADVSTATLSQVTGIIQAFIDLSTLNFEYAQLLRPAVENCIGRIGDSCNFDGNTLTISENSTFISVIQAVEIGVAFIRYGKLSDNSILEKSGYVIVNSYLNNNNSFDLRTLANLYPILAYDNWYYPHFAKINVDENNKWLWAWTCAKNIGYNKDEQGTITLSFDFPETYTHYVIVKNLPRFNYIYIYNISFRTDSRFENYNSSGYVYKFDTQTLLLKSRQKEAIENVRFEYFVHEPEKPVETETKIIDISPEATEKTEASEAATTETAPQTPESVSYSSFENYR